MLVQQFLCLDSGGEVHTSDVGVVQVHVIYVQQFFV